MVNTRVTVFGGSGFIGRHLATELVARGATVRIAARHAGHVSDPRVEMVVADVLDDSSVASAVVRASAVINLVGILSETGHQTYAAVHVGERGGWRSQPGAQGRCGLFISRLWARPK